MKRFTGWAMKVIGLYFLILGAYFLFAVGSMKYVGLANLERKLNPSTFVFWQSGEFYSNPPLFTQRMTDARSQLSSRELSGLGDVDIWVLLLEGFEDIRNVEFAPQLGVGIEDVATSKPGVTVNLTGASLKMRLHPIPFIVDRKQVLILDAQFLRENYKDQCLDEMVYYEMIGQRDQELWDRCRTT